MASVAEPFLQNFRFRLAFGVSYCEVLCKHIGFTFEMLLKYLTQSKIRLIVKAPVVIFSVLQKNMQRASRFRVGCSCKLSTIFFKAESTSIMCSFSQKPFLLNFVLVFRAAVLF